MGSPPLSGPGHPWFLDCLSLKPDGWTDGNIMSQKCAIGFSSGECGGHSAVSIASSSRNCLHYFATCSSSCTTMHEVEPRTHCSSVGFGNGSKDLTLMSNFCLSSTVCLLSHLHLHLLTPISRWCWELLITLVLVLAVIIFLVSFIDNYSIMVTQTGIMTLYALD